MNRAEKPNPAEEPECAPLAGVKVLDLTRVLAGPYATTLLADLGAEVLKVEEVGSGDSTRKTQPMVRGIGNHFMNLNRNKRSIAVDLKAPEGREIILSLLEHYDVVVENFRPGVLDRLGLGYNVLQERNQRVILCSISGFGQNNEYSRRPSFDIIVQALSGAMAVTGEEGRPPVRLGIPMGDLSGGIFGAIGTLSAIVERATTGVGRHVDVSMLDGLVQLTLFYPLDFLNLGVIARPVGGRHDHVAPYGVFEVADGYIVLAVFQGKFWRAYCESIGREDLITDDRFRTAELRLANREVLYSILEPVMLQRERDDWVARLTAVEVPCAPILGPHQIAEHPLMQAREMFVESVHPVAGPVTVSGPVIKQVGRRRRKPRPAPLLGEHSEGVLAEIGYSQERISELVRYGVVGSASQNEKAAGVGTAPDSANGGL
jgi:crotonobetainyl-CoA:carnitine CoA-transferase CaiB-like acyl-CoA transferase